MRGVIMSENSYGNYECCPSMTNCPLYPYFKNESSKKVFILRYCAGKFENCERRKRMMAEEIMEIPHNLLPNGELLKQKEN